MSADKWDLTRLTTGERCALKRAAGSLEFDVAAWSAYYRACITPPDKERIEWFAAMCMDCLWRETDEVRVYPMEDCLRMYLTLDADATDSFIHRVESLLETRWDREAFLLGKLMNIVRIIKGKTDLKPDFEALADDLRWWDGEKRSVQRRWLRALYGGQSTKTDESEGGTEK